MKIILKLSLIPTLVLFIGCATHESQKDPRVAADGSYQEVFQADFEETWRAAQMVMRAYRMRVLDRDRGYLETERIKGVEAYRPPHLSGQAPGGLRYSLAVAVIRGKKKSPPLTKIAIMKKAEIERDFFSNPETTKSDGYEEKALLYRIQREILIDRAIQKVAQ